MTASSGCRMCLPLSVAWIAAVAALAYLSWPHVPLDMSPNDPDTEAAFATAVMKHCLVYGLTALLPPVAAWLIARKSAGRNSR